MSRKSAVPASVLQLLEKRESTERRAQVRRSKSDRRAVGKASRATTSNPAVASAKPDERRTGAERRKPAHRRHKLRRKSGR